MTTENDRKMAEEIVDLWPGGMGASEYLVPAIAAALSGARRVPKGHVRTPDGVDRKVLGTLRTTLDGLVIGDGGEVYMLADNWRDGKCVYRITASLDLGEPNRPETFADPARAADFLNQEASRRAESARQPREERGA